MTEPRGEGSRSRNYPPLAIAGLVAVVLLALLPSGLNLPQSNPSQTLEYAPVPPDDETPPSESGNLSTLGLGRSSSIGQTGTGPAGGGAAAGAASLVGGGKNPRTKKCVGNPPRQAEDPLSPPCVAHFSGDNFGATYQGVTRDEVRVLLYINGGTYAGNSRGQTNMPPGTYWDLGQPPKDDEPLFAMLLRGYQRYFNDRYQTYGRFVHFYVRFADPTGQHTAESRASDAANDFQTVKPAMVVLYVPEFAAEYVGAMARRGVIAFLGNGGGGGILAATERAETFRRFAPRLWGYYPSVEQRARTFVSYLCTKVVPYPVSFSGNNADLGRPRRLGLLREGSPSRQDRIAFSRLVKEGVEACGGEWAAEGSVTDTVGPDEAARAGNDMALFVRNGVTTIIRAGGHTAPSHPRAATAANYYPEWIVAGDGLSDSNLNSQIQDPGQWAHARAVSQYHLGAPIDEQHCFVAAREADPSLARIDVKNWSCGFYPGLRMLFTGIQVAGPRFSPSTLDRGYHAIPDVRSTDPSVPSCYYDPGDFTCVKDAVAEWWDASGEDPGSGARGCWRVMEGGRRYTAGTWKPGDVEAQRSPSDPCNFQGVGAT